MIMLKYVISAIVNLLVLATLHFFPSKWVVFCCIMILFSQPVILVALEEIEAYRREDKLD